MRKMILWTAMFTIIDQLVKGLIKTLFSLHESVIVIKDFFSLTYVQNTGAAFSILSGNRILLIAMGVLSIALIYLFFIRNTKLDKIETVAYSLLLGGIIGNLIDRIIFGYVIDYFDFLIINYSFPVFNLADTFIVISIALIFIMQIRSEKNANN